MSDNCLKRMASDMEAIRRKKIAIMLRNGEIIKGTVDEVSDDCVRLSEYMIGHYSQNPEEVITITLESIMAYTGEYGKSGFSNMKSLSGSVID